MLAAPPEVWGKVKQNGNQGDHWITNIRAFMQAAEGAYSLTLLTRDAIYAVPDPLGLRPLCLGQLDDKSYVIVSESCALGTIGADFLRSVKPGEIGRLDASSLHSFTGLQSTKQAMCIFEYVYFPRPDSTLNGLTTRQVRQQFGRELALLLAFLRSMHYFQDITALS